MLTRLRFTSDSRHSASIFALTIHDIQQGGSQEQAPGVLKNKIECLWQIRSSSSDVTCGISNRFGTLQSSDRAGRGPGSKTSRIADEIVPSRNAWIMASLSIRPARPILMRPTPLLSSPQRPRFRSPLVSRVRGAAGQSSVLRRSVGKSDARQIADSHCPSGVEKARCCARLSPLQAQKRRVLAFKVCTEVSRPTRFELVTSAFGGQFNLRRRGVIPLISLSPKVRPQLRPQPQANRVRTNGGERDKKR
jgi:hypothetical protein